MSSEGPEPGWYFESETDHSERYWNGSAWTGHRRQRQSGWAPEPPVSSVPQEVAELVDAPGDAVDRSPAMRSQYQVGQLAKVVVGEKYHLGQVGKIVSVDGADVAIKFPYTIGKTVFRRDHLVVVSDNADPAPYATGSAAQLRRMTAIEADAGATDMMEDETSWDPESLPAEALNDPSGSAAQDGFRSSPDGASPRFPTSSTSMAHRWSWLTMKLRIAVVAVSILLLAFLLALATGMLAARGPLDRKWANRSDSYKAGFESGAGYVDEVEEQGGSPGSEDDILGTCNLFASHGASLRAGVHWSGGIIPHGDFSAEVYRNGCIDGAADARG